MPKSFKGEVIADSTNTWVSNACRFATEREAAVYVNDLARRWMLVRQVRAAESDEPVSCRFDEKTGKVIWL